MLLRLFLFFFFFSSRRRHTRWPRDWSSDVCSSDLISRLPLLLCDDERRYYRNTHRSRNFSINLFRRTDGSHVKDAQTTEERATRKRLTKYTPIIPKRIKQYDTLDKLFVVQSRQYFPNIQYNHSYRKTRKTNHIQQSDSK